MSDVVVAKRYRLGRRIGSGGMGRVWLARDEVLRRSVAIKEVLLPDGLTEAEAVELRLRTLREARAAARLSHPGVIKIYDVMYAEERPWIVMEYVQSRSLAQVIKEDGPIRPQRVAQIGLSLLSALTAAHEAGVLHRDIKPGNVLLGEDGRVVLTDFGLATFDDIGTQLTQTGVVHGSPQFIAPERALDGTSSPQADLWSLGATLYAAVEGKAPYSRGSSYATLTALATAPPDPPQRAGALKPVLGGLLRRNPRSRISAEEARVRLQQIANGEQPSRLIPKQRAADSGRNMPPEAPQSPAPQSPGSQPPGPQSQSIHSLRPGQFGGMGMGAAFGKRDGRNATPFGPPTPPPRYVPRHGAPSGTPSGPSGTPSGPSGTPIGPTGAPGGPTGAPAVPSTARGGIGLNGVPGGPYPADPAADGLSRRGRPYDGEPGPTSVPAATFGHGAAGGRGATNDRGLANDRGAAGGRAAAGDRSTEGGRGTAGDRSAPVGRGAASDRDAAGRRGAANDRGAAGGRAGTTYAEPEFDPDVETDHEMDLAWALDEVDTEAPTGFRTPKKSAKNPYQKPKITRRTRRVIVSLIAVVLLGGGATAIVLLTHRTPRSNALPPLVVTQPSAAQPSDGQPVAASWPCTPTAPKSARPFPQSAPIDTKNGLSPGWAFYVAPGPLFQVPLPSSMTLATSGSTWCFNDPTTPRLLGVQRWQPGTKDPIAALKSQLADVSGMPGFKITSSAAPVLLTPGQAQATVVSNGPTVPMQTTFRLLMGADGVAYTLQWTTTVINAQEDGFVWGIVWPQFVRFAGAPPSTAPSTAPSGATTKSSGKPSAAPLMSKR